MHKLKMFVLPGLFVLLSEILSAQERAPKIAIVNQVDTLVTHVYVDPWHNMQFKKDVFDYGDYSVKELLGIFDRAHFDAIELETPIWFNRMNYMNFFGKPSRQIKAWLTSLKLQYDVDYLIVILHKWYPDPAINYGFLDGRQYGIASYATNQNAVTLYSFVGYYIFSTETLTEVKLNPNHDKYVIVNVGVEERLSFREIMKLPDRYFKLCKDKLRNVADTRNVEIRRVMLEEVGE